jgi:hypothetical protein
LRVMTTTDVRIALPLRFPVAAGSGNYFASRL